MIVDLVVLVVLIISAAISFLRGFIRETLTILGVVGGLAAAYLGGPILNPYMRSWLGVKEGEDPQRLFDIIPYTLLADVLSYGCIFIGVVIVLSIISHMLAETVRSVGLGSIDRTLGIFFGLARGVILLALLYMPLHLLLNDEAKAAWFEGSTTHFYLEQSAEYIASLVPDETVEKWESDVQALQESATKNGERIRQIDVLKGEDPAALDQPQDGEDAATGKQGYTEEFRQHMDRLFEQKTVPAQAPPPAPPQDAVPLTPAAPPPNQGGNP